MSRSRRLVRHPPLGVLTLLLVMAAAGTAQQWGYRGGWRGAPMREGLPDAGGHVDRGFTFCRLYFESIRREGHGQGWRTDYPDADQNFLYRFEQLSTVQIARWADGELGHTVMRATDPDLFQCPFLFAEDVGTVGLSAEEEAGLRTYLLKGGFLWADDFWGDRAWDHWEAALARVLPEYEIVDVPVDHPLMSAVYIVPDIPQVPSIQFWNESGRRSTSERGRESAEPHLRAVFDEAGRPMVMMTHNTDIADGWEREGQDEEFFYHFSPRSYGLGINVVIWALSH